MVQIFLQARVSSSRLPAKVLLPISEFKLIELSYLRLSNSGLPVTVCTSNHKSDDILCHYLTLKNIRFFRGSLNDVLSRFYFASEGLSPNTIIVRATADNCFPNGEFVEILLDEFTKLNAQYLYANGKENNLPDGLKVEIFKLSELHEAHEKAQTEYEKEHVTPYIINKFQKTFSKSIVGENWGHLSATIDTLDDYLKISNLFANIKENAVKIPFAILCKYLNMIEVTT